MRHALLALVLLGCGETEPTDDTGTDDTAEAPALADDFEDDLEYSGGCADVVFYAASADDTVLVHFYSSERVAEAEAAGEETSWTFTFPTEDAELKAELGEHLSDVVCDDVQEFEEVVDVRYLPTSGTATLTIRPGGDTGPKADLVLEDVVLEPEGGGDPVTVESLTWADVFVGWLPG